MFSLALSEGDLYARWREFGENVRFLPFVRFDIGERGEQIVARW